MHNLLSTGLRKNVFSYQDVAELVFGKVVVNVDNVDLEAKTGTKFVTWEMRDCQAFPPEIRRQLIWNMRGDIHHPNYDFVKQRVLCAFGYQCVMKEPAEDVKHTLINWTTVFTTMTPNVKNAAVLPIKEVQWWHDAWGMPYFFEEVSLIQQIVASELSHREDLFENNAYWEQLRKDINVGLSYKWGDMSSKMSFYSYYVNRMIDFLINIRYTAEQVR